MLSVVAWWLRTLSLPDKSSDRVKKITLRSYAAYPVRR